MSLSEESINSFKEFKKEKEDFFKSKIKIVQNPNCSSEIIAEILNDKTIDWNLYGLYPVADLVTEIVSHANTNLPALISMFSCYNSPVLSKLKEEESQNQRKLILENPNWDLDKVIDILADKLAGTTDGDEKCFIVGSIADVDVLDEDSEKKIYNQLSGKVNSIYCLCEWALKIIDMGDKNLAEELLNQAPKVPSDLCDYWDYKTLAETTIEFVAGSDKSNLSDDLCSAVSNIYNMAIQKIENLEEWDVLYDETTFEFLKITLLKHLECPVEILTKALEEGNDNLNDVIVEKLEPVGFGTFMDPNTREIVAVTKGGKLTPYKK